MEMEISQVEAEMPVDIEPQTVEVETEKKKYNFSNAQKYRWKGKVVTEKYYNRMIKLTEVGRTSGKNRAKKNASLELENESNNVKEDSPEFPVKGDRIVDIEFMSKMMKCTECQGHLLLENIRREIRRRSRSIFHIECHSCKVINKVPTKG